MGKFIIECPDCGSYVELKKGLFAKKTVKCACGRIINSKEDTLTSKVCSHCGNTVMFNQRKGEKATCPVCHNLINTVEDKFALVDLKCPSCSSMQKINKKNATHVCTVCGEVIDVQKLLAHTSLKESGNASVIKWDGSEDLLVYKHPIENFNLGSQLIVNVGQEALLFRDGKALDLFGAGRYTLEKNLIPELNEIYKLPEDTDISIQSEVYFINKIVLMGIKWGTPNKVRVMEQTMNFPIEIGARGSFNLEIIDSKTFISRVIGKVGSYVTNNIDGGKEYGIQYVREKFADMIVQEVTSMLARIIAENKINLLMVDSMKPSIAKLLGNAINNSLTEFGLKIPDGQFYVTDIVTPDDDPNYIKMKKQYTVALDLKDSENRKLKIDAEGEVAIAQKQVEVKLNTIEAESEASIIKTEGQAIVDVYRDMSTAEADALKAKGGDYAKETDRIVNSQVAENGVAFVNVSVSNEPEKWDCSCGKKGITSKFCPDCGSKKK